MSTIITIQPTHQPKDSRADINSNFANLNTDKQEKAAGAVTGRLTRFGAANVLEDSGKTVSDFETAGAVAAHEAAADPHTGYQRESEKAVANGYASLGADGKVPAGQLPPSGGGMWTLVARGTFTTGQQIGGTLDGNTHKRYKVVLKMRDATGGQVLGLRLNNDTAANYHINIHWAGFNVSDQHSMYSGAATRIYSYNIHDNYFMDIDIDAKTGQSEPRPFFLQGYSWNSTSARYAFQGGGLWNNTTANITRMDIDLNGATVSEGEYWIYRITDV